ncbi:hypothetical protein [Acinetobacter sp. MB5]|uniref:hypothetical protein n=1 Tax=Acinetobacter sp. MB5 TaxID=2069438 RepID=UPI000DD0B547|nr:hypothetical protein [Acinetobacter sp. MB5]
MRSISLIGVAVSMLTAATGVLAESPLEWTNADGTESFQVGGVIRFNQRYESWPTSTNRGFGKLNFDIFRLDLKGKYHDFYTDSSLLLQNDQYTSIEKAYVGYNINAKNSVDVGLVYKPFAIYPYPQNGWTYHIPFFLGYGDNIAPGVNWNYNDKDWDIKLGYYPRMLDTNLRYAPESAKYSDLTENAFPSQSKYQNEKQNQFNARIVKKFDTSVGKQEFGVSGAVSQLHNSITGKNGSYYAAAAHANTNINRWNIQGSVIHYKYDAKNPDGVSNDVTLMGTNGITPAYFIASEGTVSSLNVAYTLPLKNMGKLKAIKFYDDFSYFDKKRSDWAASQMNTTGMMFIASPFLVWVDYTWGKNANILGGSSNSTGFTSATSVNSNKWLYRVNLNIGFKF